MNTDLTPASIDQRKADAAALIAVARQAGMAVETDAFGRGTFLFSDVECLRRLIDATNAVGARDCDAPRVPTVEQDAERYRFLRDQADPDAEQPYVTVHKTNSWGKWFNSWESGEALDTAIDAARGMEARSGETEGLDPKGDSPVPQARAQEQEREAGATSGAPEPHTHADYADGFDAGTASLSPAIRRVILAGAQGQWTAELAVSLQQLATAHDAAMAGPPDDASGAPEPCQWEVMMGPKPAAYSADTAKCARCGGKAEACEKQRAIAADVERRRAAKATSGAGELADVFARDMLNAQEKVAAERYIHGTGQRASGAPETAPGVERNNPVSALAIRFLVGTGAVTQEQANEAFTAACSALEDEAGRMNVSLPWVRDNGRAGASGAPETAPLRAAATSGGGWVLWRESDPTGRYINPLETPVYAGASGAAEPLTDFDAAITAYAEACQKLDKDGMRKGYIALRALAERHKEAVWQKIKEASDDAEAFVHGVEVVPLDNLREILIAASRGDRAILAAPKREAEPQGGAD